MVSEEFCVTTASKINGSDRTRWFCVEELNRSVSIILQTFQLQMDEDLNRRPEMLTLIKENVWIKLKFLFTGQKF